MEKEENKEEIESRTELEEQGKAEEQDIIEIREVISEISDMNKKSHKASGKKKKLAAVIAVCVVAALAVYAGGIFYYKSHFMPGIKINNMDVRNMNTAEVLSLIESVTENYSLSVVGRDEDGNESVIGVINASDIGLSNMPSADSLNELIAGQNYLTWPVSFITNKVRVTTDSSSGNVINNEVSSDTDNGINDYILRNVIYDEDSLKALIGSFTAFEKKNIVEPEDAYISDYSENLRGYEIIPETLGNKPDVEKVTEAVKAALTEELSDTLNVSECYVTAQVTSEDKGLNQALNQANTWTSADIEYDWNGSKVLVDADVIKDWISFEEESGKIKAVLDEDAIGAFVKENAKANDTYGKKRKFTTTLGTELTLPGGAYGWKTDTAAETEALIASIKKGETASAREPEYASRGANKGSEDIGTSYVEIDLTNQHLYLYEEGEIVLETDFVSGNMSNGNYTPQGVFGITYKTKNAVLRGADYATPVNYWMPFNGNVGMHDATWRSSFGGDIYLTSGSHGCVNLPLDKAAEIYEYMSAGFPVICYYY